ncbi:hypothetical protein GUITHDRAFT_101906 [Guillardia theta CCMP2712]|uniref:Uncharacterized protein n=1 Tax=Guillardia theta (strain CCMP2712) TaxID=905079 RepID=L1JWP6_GUITC|nr:hypothetical protein GUITHDRAFT_101906 [Guillardia theta CCMP2712]EKX52754.1 hypothetical protein GUITHDRAFT_101906 [Guillardia theta CCMP2712]|eukprot:XP_005839734.1 hypothetical protein GUITHDRAFT_101906 [Guillardia theta CCMP2712]
MNVDQQVISYELSLQPWKSFNFTVPTASAYCQQQFCLRCSKPVEWDPQGHQQCRVSAIKANGTKTITKIEMSSSLYQFDSLLFCLTTPGINISQMQFSVEKVVEGGTLFNTEGNFGELSDFLSNDEFYASSFQYMRYDNFYESSTTSSFAHKLVEPRGGVPNCALLSSTKWKTNTRYELTISISGTASKLEDSEYIPQNGAGWLSMSVRGDKFGSKCDIAAELVNNNGCQWGLDNKTGNVSTDGRMHFLPSGMTLNDLIRNQSCVVKPGNQTSELMSHQYSWTNLGLTTRANPANGVLECCPPNSISQLIGNQACGAAISPNPIDVDLTISDFSLQLPDRLCNRFGRIYEIFKQGYCPLPCIQDGNLDFTKIPKGTFGQTCSCNISILANESQYNDAYMARAIMEDFMWQAKSLYDEHSLVRVKKYVREKGLDIDARRPGQPTRRRGLEKKWIDGKPGNETFQDAYNNYIDFKMQDPSQHVGLGFPALRPDMVTMQVVEELGQVEDFDTLYYAELNVRMLGILLAEEAFTPIIGLFMATRRVSFESRKK